MSTLSNKPRKVIERAVAVDLLAAVYRAEGWTRREGESRAVRVKRYYDLTADPRRNRYIATPKGCCCTNGAPS